MHCFLPRDLSPRSPISASLPAAGPANADSPHPRLQPHLSWGQGGSQGIRASWDFLCRLLRAEPLNCAQLIQFCLERGEEVGAAEVIIGGARRLQGRSWATSPSIAQISPVCGLGSKSETFRPFPKVTDCISEA